MQIQFLFEISKRKAAKQVPACQLKLSNLRDKFFFWGWRWDVIWVPKYLVSPKDKVVLTVVTVELKGNILVYIILLMKRRAFSLNRFRNLISTIAAYYQIVYSFVKFPVLLLPSEKWPDQFSLNCVSRYIMNILSVHLSQISSARSPHPAPIEFLATRLLGRLEIFDIP